MPPTLSTAGLFGNFLYNSEREQTLDAGKRRTASLWHSMLASPLRKGTYTNECYNPQAVARVLAPRLGMGFLQLWQASFCRWYDDPFQGREA